MLRAKPHKPRFSVSLPRAMLPVAVPEDSGVRIKPPSLWGEFLLRTSNKTSGSLSLLRQTDAAHEVLKARVGTQRIERGPDLQRGGFKTLSGYLESQVRLVIRGFEIASSPVQSQRFGGPHKIRRPAE